MKYEIELPGVDELAERVVGHVSSVLLQGGVRRRGGDEDDYEDGVRDKIESRVVERVTERIDAEVTAIVTDYLGRPVQPTNNFGEPIGEPITLRSRIAGQVTRWLDEKVDHNGKAREAGGYAYGREEKTRAEWAIKGAVEEIAAKELKQAVNDAGAEVRAQIKGKVTAATAEVIGRILGIPT